MDRTLFQDMTPGERAKMLADNAEKKEEFQYPRELTPDEISELKDNLSSESITLSKLEERKKELMDEMKAEIKPVKEKVNRVLQLLRTRIEEVEENVFLIADQEEGEAPRQSPEYRDNPYNINGGPGTVLEVLSKDPLKTLEAFFDGDNFLLVDRDEHFIKLEVISSVSHLSDIYLSILKLSKQIDEFGINTGKNWTPFELANFIKMNRTFFESKAKAMELVSLLRNFKAKVDKDIENADDTRGNKKVLLQQTVDSNVPESFKITIPIFKGVEHQTVSVEIMIDASDFSCQLISPEAKDFIDTESNRIIDQELDKIKDLHPDLKVIEVI